MIDKKQVEALKKEIEEDIKDMKTYQLSRIQRKVSALRKKMDHYDSIVQNIIDFFKLSFTEAFKSKQEQISVELIDIIVGFEHYSEDDKRYTFAKLDEIAKLYDRGIWQKLKDVLKAS